MPERRAHRAAIALLLVVAGALAGCGALGVGGGTGGSDPSGTSPDAGRATPTAAAVATGDAGQATPGPLVVDPQLLRHLPARVDGLAIVASPTTAAGMIKDPSLASSASAIAVGVVVAAGDSRGDDLAVSTVVQLRPGVYSDAFYGQWRSAYDAAACAPAGGVSSHVQELIGSHTVEVTVCGQGARTYHTHLPGDVLVSITAVGTRKFGDLVMAGLRE